jgi:hypothetical protein
MVLATLSGASRLWAGLEAPVQGGAGVGYLFESGSSVNLSAAAGMSRSAPTISTSLGWRVPIASGE